MIRFVKSIFRNFRTRNIVFIDSYSMLASCIVIAYICTLQFLYSTFLLSLQAQPAIHLINSILLRRLLSLSCFSSLIVYYYYTHHTTLITASILCPTNTILFGAISRAHFKSMTAALLFVECRKWRSERNHRRAGSV